MMTRIKNTIMTTMRILYTTVDWLSLVNRNVVVADAGGSGTALLPISSHKLGVGALSATTMIRFSKLAVWLTVWPVVKIGCR